MITNLMKMTTRERDNYEMLSKDSGVRSSLVEKFINFKQGDVVSNTFCYVVDTADDLMETANKNVDKYIREKQTEVDYEKEIEKAFALKNESAPSVPGKTSEIISRTKHYLLKPQLSFERKVDNSYFQFVPMIRHKENALTQLHPRIKQLQTEYAEYLKKNPKIEYDMNASVLHIKTPHPYEDEIEALNIDWNKMVEEVSAITSTLPAAVTESEFAFIDKLEQLDQFMIEIEGCKELAIDLEYHSYRSYQGFTCLMQLSTREKDYIIDTIALRSHLHVLNRVFMDPKVVKVLHGSRYDIQWLQKDFGVYMVNLFDTGEAAKVLGLKASLANLLKHYCDVTANKQYQLADWRQRPLPEEMVKYAREDTHYLLYIYDVMRKELMTPKNSDDDPVVFLKSVWKSSKALCLQTYQKPKAKDTEFYAIIARNAVLMGEGSIKILEMLLTWRDYVARVEDESVKFVMPNDVLFDLAKSAPQTLSDLEIVLKRHPKNTHHDCITKYSSDLLSRITSTISTHTLSIKSRIASKPVPCRASTPSSSSSSSSASPVRNPVPISPSSIQLKMHPRPLRSQLFPESSQASVSRPVLAIQNFAAVLGFDAAQIHIKPSEHITRTLFSSFYLKTMQFSSIFDQNS